MVRAFVTMLPRLQAQEQLDAIRAQALAFGGYAENDREEMMSTLRAAAAGEEIEDEEPTRATPELLAAMGIGIVSAPSGKGMSGV